MSGVGSVLRWGVYTIHVGPIIDGRYYLARFLKEGFEPTYMMVPLSYPSRADIEVVEGEVIEPFSVSDGDSLEAMFFTAVESRPEKIDTTRLQEIADRLREDNSVLRQMGITADMLKGLD